MKQILDFEVHQEKLRPFWSFNRTQKAIKINYDTQMNIYSYSEVTYFYNLKF